MLQELVFRFVVLPLPQLGESGQIVKIQPEEVGHLFTITQLVYLEQDLEQLQQPLAAMHILMPLL